MSRPISQGTLSVMDSSKVDGIVNFELAHLSTEFCDAINALSSQELKSTLFEMIVSNMTNPGISVVSLSDVMLAYIRENNTVDASSVIPMSVSNLVNGTKYFFQFHMNTSNCCVNFYSNTVSAIPRGVPKAPVLVEGYGINNGILLTLQAVAENSEDDGYAGIDCISFILANFAVGQEPNIIEISLPYTYQENDQTFTISDLINDNTYEVTAYYTNEQGRSPLLETTTILVSPNPDPVRNLAASNVHTDKISTSAIKLDWNAPIGTAGSSNWYGAYTGDDGNVDPNSALISYLIESSLDNENFIEVATVDAFTLDEDGNPVYNASGSYEDIPPVESGTQLYYRVTAINGYGPGVIANPVPIKFLQPSSPVQGLTAHSNLNIRGVVSLSWTEPATLNGDLVAYEVTDSDGNVLTRTTNTSFDHIIFVTPPRTGETQGYQVVAITGHPNNYDEEVPGEITNENLPETGLVSTIICEYPDPVTDLVASITGSNEITLTWTPSANLQGMPFNSYVITISPDAEDGSNTYTVDEEDVTTYTVQNLSNGTTYDMSVNVVTTDLNDASGNTLLPSTEVGISYTAVGVPTAPLNLVAQPDVENLPNINLSWEEPEDFGGDVLQYYLVTRTSGGANQTTFNAGTNLSFVDDNSLVLGTMYSYTVAAVIFNPNLVDTVVEGEQSNLSSATAFILPDAPVVDTPVAGNGSISLTWSPPAFTGGLPISGYQIVDLSSNDTYDYDATELSATISSLVNGVPYEFAIYAIVTYSGEDFKSAESSPFDSCTPFTDPEPVTNLVAMNAGLSNNVSWVLPSVVTGGFAISSLTLTRTDTLNSRPVEWTLSSSDTTYSDSSNLVYGVLYTYSIVVHTIAQQVYQDDITLSSTSESVSVITQTTPDITSISISSSEELPQTISATILQNGSALTNYLAFAIPASDPSGLYPASRTSFSSFGVVQNSLSDVNAPVTLEFQFDQLFAIAGVVLVVANASGMGYEIYLSGSSIGEGSAPIGNVV